MLKVENLSVSYGYVTALTDVSFEIHQGEIVTLIGSNGAGKTTCLMAISGLVPKETGKITFLGIDITHKSPNRIVNMGMSHVPEGRQIFPSLSVHENLLAGAMGRPGRTKAQIAEQVERMFSLFPRLKERRNQGGGTLSGGEQQMLAIARGLMMDPDILMLDEPSLGLAPILVEEIFALIQNIHRQGKTILLIEQNAAMALSIADRGYVLESGRIALSGTGRELLNDQQVRSIYLGG